MHEISICEALLIQVRDIAVAESSKCSVSMTVKTITIEMGPLSGVDPGIFRSAFDVMRANGCAGAADLVIEAGDVRVECIACGEESAATANRLICGVCGGYRTAVVSGQELRLLRVELRLN
jgi:hydrogenase nickel incorporation protein HypA/HybF